MSGPTKKPTAVDRLGDFMRARELEDQQRRDAVIAEFGGDARALAGEVLRLRHGIGQLAAALGQIESGRPL